MGIGRIARVGRVARAGQGGLAAALTGNDILTITDSGIGTALVTTAAPHGLSGFETVAISGASVGGYNGSFNLFDAPSATTFTLQAAYISDSTGGTWALA